MLLSASLQSTLVDAEVVISEPTNPPWLLIDLTFLHPNSHVSKPHMPSFLWNKHFKGHIWRFQVNFAHPANHQYCIILYSYICIYIYNATNMYPPPIPIYFAAKPLGRCGLPPPSLTCDRYLGLVSSYLLCGFSIEPYNIIPQDFIPSSLMKSEAPA